VGDERAQEHHRLLAWMEVRAAGVEARRRRVPAPEPAAAVPAQRQCGAVRDDDRVRCWRRPIAAELWSAIRAVRVTPAHEDRPARPGGARPYLALRLGRKAEDPPARPPPGLGGNAR